MSKLTKTLKLVDHIHALWNTLTSEERNVFLKQIGVDRDFVKTDIRWEDLDEVQEYIIVKGVYMLLLGKSI